MFRIYRLEANNGSLTDRTSSWLGGWVRNRLTIKISQIGVKQIMISDKFVTCHHHCYHQVAKVIFTGWWPRNTTAIIMTVFFYFWLLRLQGVPNKSSFLNFPADMLETPSWAFLAILGHSWPFC